MRRPRNPPGTGSQDAGGNGNTIPGGLNGISSTTATTSPTPFGTLGLTGPQRRGPTSSQTFQTGLPQIHGSRDAGGTGKMIPGGLNGTSSTTTVTSLPATGFRGKTGQLQRRLTWPSQQHEVSTAKHVGSFTLTLCHLVYDNFSRFAHVSL